MEEEEGFEVAPGDDKKNENIKTDEIELEAKKFFETYKKELLQESLKKETTIMYIDFAKLTEFSNKLSEEILKNPEWILQIVEQAIEETGLFDGGVRVRLKNLFPSQEVKIRNIRAKHLNELIMFDGIIRQTSDVRPHVVEASFECPSCGTVMKVMQMDNKFREPSRCACGRRGGFKVLKRTMVDTQRLILEESPDSLTGGEQPKRINVFIKEDLVEPRMEEKTTPGSKVKVIGVLKEVPIPLKTGGISTKFEICIVGNNIIPLEETFEELNISEEDEQQILELAQDPEIVQKLATSIAPSVWGYEEIKKSLVLQLFGGVQKSRADGSKTRGDIHVLLIGDPGVAKSVMLGFMAGISPKGRYVVGKSSSGAGLTATVVRDEYLKGWGLEAGAMVLANKGLVCIDELEKMDPVDRSAMHEAMEQQTVTISKANVQATLKAETSVLAAANPKLGRFEPSLNIPTQIDLPPTLINRFDLMFTMRDLPNLAKDEHIADHVLREHQKTSTEMLIPRELFRKYVAYAKQRIRPELSDIAVQEIKSFYITLRGKAVSYDGEDRIPIPITARQLVALIRMAEAAAKLRLSTTVTQGDAKLAIELMKYCLMQVGYDEATNQFDIDKMSTKLSSSQRGQVVLIKETIEKIENDVGKLIPVEEIEKALEGKVSASQIEAALAKLSESGDIFVPRRGYVQRTKS